MKNKYLAGLAIVLLFSATSVAFAVEQTICFSQRYIGKPSKYFPKGVPQATLGDKVTLNGGQCDGATLVDMNEKGWRLVFVVTGLENSFGMVLEKQ